MKYINTTLRLFDTCTFSQISNFGITGGEGKIPLPAETTKLYVSCNLYTMGTSNSSCWPVQIYFSDGAYNKIIDSTVQLHYDGGNDKLYLKTNNTARLETTLKKYTNRVVYLAIDTVTGTIDFYIKSSYSRSFEKVGTFTGYVKTGVKAISCKIKLQKFNSSRFTRIKDIIISDRYFPKEETVLETDCGDPVLEGWVKNNSDYTTETENSTLKIKKSLKDDYNTITSCNLVIPRTTLGDTIKNLQLEAGDYSATKAIPTNGNGMYYDGLPANLPAMTLKAKK